jgi:hypothetical protein
MPFIFVMGTIASKAELMGPISVGQYTEKDIAFFGKNLRSATQGIVMAEMDMIRDKIRYMREINVQ